MPIDLPDVSFDTSTQEHDKGRLQDATETFTKAKGALGSRLNRTIQIVADEHSDVPEGIEAAAQFMDGLATFLAKEGPDIAEALHRQITSGSKDPSDKGDTIQVTQLRENVRELEASQQQLEADRERLADEAERYSDQLATLQQRHQQALNTKDQRIAHLDREAEKADRKAGEDASRISNLEAENQRLKQAQSGNADQALTDANTRIAELEAQLESDKASHAAAIQAKDDEIAAKVKEVKDFIAQWATYFIDLEERHIANQGDRTFTVAYRKVNPAPQQDPPPPADSTRTDSDQPSAAASSRKGWFGGGKRAEARATREAAKSAPPEHGGGVE